MTLTAEVLPDFLFSQLQGQKSFLFRIDEPFGRRAGVHTLSETWIELRLVLRFSLVYILDRFILIYSVPKKIDPEEFEDLSDEVNRLKAKIQELESQLAQKTNTHGEERSSIVCLSQTSQSFSGQENDDVILADWESDSSPRVCSVSSGTVVNRSTFPDLQGVNDWNLAVLESEELNVDKGISSVADLFYPLKYTEELCNQYTPQYHFDFEEPDMGIDCLRYWLHSNTFIGTEVDSNAKEHQNPAAPITHHFPVAPYMLQLLIETYSHCLQIEAVISRRSLADRFSHPETPTDSIAACLLLGLSAHHLYVHHVITLEHATQLRRTFHAQAKMLMDNGTDLINLGCEMIEIYLLQSAHFLLDNMIGEASNHLRFAVNLAQAQGCNRPSSLSELDPIEAEIRKRMFHLCYVHDFIMSFQTGVLYIIKDNEIDHDLPEPMEGEDETRRTTVNFLSRLIALILIWRKSSRSLDVLFPSDMTPATEETADILKFLVQWYTELPPHFQPLEIHPDTPALDPCTKQAKTLLNVLYHALWIKARRNQADTAEGYFISGASPDQSYAAEGILDTMNIASPDFAWCPHAALVFDCFQLACTVRSEDLSNPDPVIRDSAKESLEKAALILPRAPPSSKQITHIEQLILGYLHNVEYN
ncbi:hypothetical protein BC937DRAFT_93853 [Endogone sp. FLAS-F59071]|nr:hypothetical protein BC937DRAFT_93853 [Endogone sp. FLAS-F59071]|eukprot:RUS21008.1 hypothetical protein BC937DRAFT_93853 [Endogone sp. FLAS-F59071]